MTDPAAGAGHAIDAWDAVLERLDDAAKLTGIDPDIHRKLRTPKRVLEVAVPVWMGSASSTSAFAVRPSPWPSSGWPAPSPLGAYFPRPEQFAVLSS